MSDQIMSKNSNRKRRKFSADYKAEVVRLCLQPGKSAYSVAKELGLAVSGVSAWVAQAKIDAGQSSPGALTSTERAELTTLRREVRTLRQEREILKAATAFFAKEGTK